MGEAGPLPVRVPSSVPFSVLVESITKYLERREDSGAIVT
jgi:hypothetical protein